jgi:hypothetical protein
VPAIVSACAGVAEHYPPELGELLIGDPNDSAELAAKLLAWRRNLERIRSAIVPLSAALRSHTWDAMAEQIAACAREQS